jgi:hypothetical protein
VLHPQRLCILTINIVLELQSSLLRPNGREQIRLERTSSPGHLERNILDGSLSEAHTPVDLVLHDIEDFLGHQGEALQGFFALEGGQVVDVVGALCGVLEEGYRAFSFTCNIHYFVLLVEKCHGNALKFI